MSNLIAKGEVKMKKVAVVIPARNELDIRKLLEGIFSSVPSGYEVLIVLVVNNSTPAFEALADSVACEDPRVYALQLGQLKSRTFAYAYLEGLKYAVEEVGADFVVEMDAGGSHDPDDLPRFVEGLQRADAVFSTRFSHGGRMVHPLQRKVASLIGTLLGNLLLGLGRFVPDLTGGYESFRREILQRLFNMVPPDEWLTVSRGPGHLYQMEMRTYLCWMRLRISLVPITMGVGKVRSPQALGPRKLLQATKTLLVLRKRRGEFLAQISQT